jgi:protease-4
MTHDSDMLVERRRLKRGLALWRALAIAALVTVVLVGVARIDDLVARDHVARLAVEGLILADRAVIEALADVADDSRAKALIVSIDSPGGTFVGGETMYHALRGVAEKKPVVAVMGGVATSAGYMTALAADRIFAHEGTITGSIGVMVQTTDLTGLLDKLGVSAEAIKSSPLKATPSPFEPLTEQARAATQSIIDDMHALFTAMVAERRGFADARARELADGRVYSGRQALELALIDAIGGEATAREWLTEEKEIPENLPTRDLEIDRPSGGWLPSIASLTGNILFSERLMLDGLISVWHPGQG